MRIRAEKASDYPAIAEILKEAFGQKAEAELVERLRDTDSYLNDFALVAEEEQTGNLIGHILFTEARVVGAGGLSFRF
ncbi:putative acetyltransferase [Listeria floridensis FSL S10-1187]|uniref:Acetyltransferase n=2 Tax=Listeria floridensis TaxID=1494962 RepID=A0ABP3AWF1_9LIST|nr:putative acetyltransferase [Listeria floridensis FSL S10-1187]